MGNPALEEQIKALSLEVIRRKGWNSFDDVVVKSEENSILIQPFIALNNMQINITVNDRFNEILQEAIVEEDLDMGLPELIDLILYKSLVHEYGHYKFCPRNRENFQNILQSSFDAIEKRETNFDVITSYCVQVHNIFSDTILNTINAHTDTEKEKYRRGLELFFQVGYNCLKKKGMKRLDKSMALHVAANFALCSTDKKAIDKVKKYFPRFFLGFERYSRKISDIFTGDKNITSEVLGYDLKSNSVCNIVERLKDESLWYKMAFDYTNLIYRFMRRDYDMFNNSFTSNSTDSSDSGSPSKKGSQQKDDKADKGNNDDKKDGKNNKKEGKEGKNEKKDDKGAGSDKNEKSGDCNPEDKKNPSHSGQPDNQPQDNKFNPNSPDKDKNDKPASGSDNNEEKKDDSGSNKKKLEEFFERLLKKGDNPEHPQSTWLQFYTKLDHLYRERAGRLAILSEGNDSPIFDNETPMFREKMPFDEFKSKGIDWGSTRVYSNKGSARSVELYRRDTPLNLNIESEDKYSGLLDLAFIFDSSSSMTFDPFTDDGAGEYHYAALTFYSIIKYLEDKSIAPLLNYLAINYSWDTYSSGWCSYDEITKVKKTIFDHQGSGTILKPAALSELRKARRDNCVAFMLADTEFNFKENENEVISEIDKMLLCGGIGFYLFQIGKPNSFSYAMEERNVPVHYINSASDFLDLTIKFTKDHYGEVSRQ